MFFVWLWVGVRCVWVRMGVGVVFDDALIASSFRERLSCARRF